MSGELYPKRSIPLAARMLFSMVALVIAGLGIRMLAKDRSEVKCTVAEYETGAAKQGAARYELSGGVSAGLAWRLPATGNVLFASVSPGLLSGAQQAYRSSHQDSVPSPNWLMNNLKPRVYIISQSQVKDDGGMPAFVAARNGVSIYGERLDSSSDAGKSATQYLEKQGIAAEDILLLQEKSSAGNRLSPRASGIMALLIAFFILWKYALPRPPLAQPVDPSLN